MATYVNRGTDPRFGGKFGNMLAWIQTKLSFHSEWQPMHVMFCFPPYISLCIPLLGTNPRRYFTFRAGWRCDTNWPGYIADVIFKPKFDRVVPY